MNRRRNIQQMVDRMKDHLEYLRRDHGSGIRYTHIMAAMEVGIAEMEKLDPEVIVFLDGNSWCAVREDFIDLMESEAGFGNTPGEAVIELEESEGARK